MGFLQSPMALIRILKDKDAVDSSSLQQTAQWFMSGEGRAAYTAANTLLKKTEYFFDYLQTVAKSKGNRSFLYKLAFVMADAMDKSSLEFAGYPNILDASKNPLVAYVASEIITDESEYRNIYIARLLCALHKEKHPKDYLFPDRKPIEKLAQRNADGSFSDMYKIERDIIWVFNADNTNRFSVGPFAYDIIGFEDDGDDTEEGFFAKEGN